jgi:serine protease Do
MLVHEGGVGATAGLLARDVILDFNGTPINNRADMECALANVTAGSKVAATIWRNNTERSVTLSF